MDYIQDNLKEVKAKIADACQRFNRKVEDVTLVAVSKTFPSAVLFEAMKSEHFLFAENKVQELIQKKEDTKASQAKIHLIGSLQSNKVNKAVEYADMIQSVGNMKIAHKINQACEKMNKKMDVLLQINTSNESQKSGFSSDFSLIQESVHRIREEFSNITLKGFMTMGPFTIDEKETKRCFNQLRTLRELINQGGFYLPELSMGMSHDFEWAIQEGATMLRIGSAVFGKRDYQV